MSSEQGLFLVTGATGTIGRYVVEELLNAGQRVRALSRNPERANLPEGVEVVRGDLDDLTTFRDALKGVRGVHLITFGSQGVLGTGKDIVKLLQQAGVERASVLGDWDVSTIQGALNEANFPWTHLQPVEFMSNDLDWVESIRDEGVVRMVGNAPSAMIHGADIAAVAVAALLGKGDTGEDEALTGPEALTPAERVEILREATGRDIEFISLTEDEARAFYGEQGLDEGTLEFMLELRLNPPEIGMKVSPTVERVTGRPGRRYAQWAVENADRFR